MLTLMVCVLGLAAGAGDDLPELVVTTDNTVIAASCRVVIPAGAVIADTDSDGVIHVLTDGITVEFAAGTVLRGSDAGADPDRYAGTGVRVVGAKGVTLRGVRARGFKVGVIAERADGLIVEDCDVSDNFRQRLRSTPTAEDSGDWMWPHNGPDFWLANYGAGVCIRESAGVTVRRLFARDVQNALVLDRVNDSRVYDNDCSFLSGWGLAMWKSGGNTISRNSFDFCIRGYSHGVYNRGQDSAGILCFEQCSNNRFIENSATHGGDGFFGFAGKEALGDAAAPDGWTGYERRGCNDNLFAGNDFSHAAAHGLELTFSFGNSIIGNLFENNAICGVWGGYSADTLIFANEFASNGGAGYGLERGGVNIEHGRRNRIIGNSFTDNSCGVHLWWDDDGALLATEWAKANGAGCEGNVIAGNSFEGDEVGVHLRGCTQTLLAANRVSAVGVGLKNEPGDQGAEPEMGDTPPPPPRLPMIEAIGEREPVGLRRRLEGRENIIMGEWGPWDHEGVMVRRGAVKDGEDGQGAVWEVFGASGVTVDPARVRGGVEVVVEGGGVPRRIVVRAREAGVAPYEVPVEIDGRVRTLAGTLVAAAWDVRVFSWEGKADPREDLAAWRELAGGGGVVERRLGELSLRYGGGGPRTLGRGRVFGPDAPGNDRFGMIATTRLRLPAGTWRLSTLSDDGVRVLVDGEPVIENWTWHGPMRDVGVVEIEEPREVEVRVEHFEIDGHSVMEFSIEPG